MTARDKCDVRCQWLQRRLATCDYWPRLPTHVTDYRLEAEARWRDDKHGIRGGRTENYQHKQRKWLRTSSGKWDGQRGVIQPMVQGHARNARELYIEWWRANNNWCIITLYTQGYDEQPTDRMIGSYRRALIEEADVEPVSSCCLLFRSLNCNWCVLCIIHFV